MGFPDRIILGRTEDENALHGGLNLDKRGAAFEQLNGSNLMQLLAQLIDARRYAQEIFTDLAEQTTKTTERLKDVSRRVSEVSAQVPEIQRIFYESSPTCFHVPTSTKLERNTRAKSGFFIRTRAPHTVDRRRHLALDPPALNQLNEFSKALDLSALKREKPGLDETNLRCGDKYSYPQYFQKQWVDQEMEKLRIEKLKRKQRRKDRRAKKGKKRKDKDGTKVTKVKKKYRDQWGNITYKEVGGAEVNIQERGGVKRVEGTLVEKSYGSTTEIQKDYGDQVQAAGTYQLNTQPREARPIQAPSQNPNQVPVEQPSPAFNRPMVPPPVVHTTQHVHVPIPEPPRPPPVMHANPTPPQQPPQHHQPQPPVHHQPSQAAPPPQPAKPAIPEFMNPYVKMKKIGIGEWQIKNKMKQQGVDPSDYDTYLGSGGAPTPPANPSGGPPRSPPTHTAPPTHRPAPRSAPAAPRPNNFLQSIQNGTALNKPKTRAPAPAPMASSGNGGLMAAIRSGGNLKKASRRAPPPPKVLTGDDALMNAIRGGHNLKSGANRKLKEKEPEEDENDIFSLLKLRQTLAVSSDEEEDSDWDSDT